MTITEFLFWLFVVGVFFLIFSYQFTLAVHHVRVKNWPRSTGEIVESTVRPGHREGGVDWYEPFVRFRYPANGSVRESQQFAFNRWLGSKTYAESVVARYPVGSTQTVHHHPGDADQAVIETAYPAVSVALAIGSGILFFFSLTPFWAHFRG